MARSKISVTERKAWINPIKERLYEISAGSGKTLVGCLLGITLRDDGNLHIWIDRAEGVVVSP